MDWQEAYDLKEEFIRKYKSEIRKAQGRCYLYDYMSVDYKNAVSYWNKYLNDLWKEFIEAKNFTKSQKEVAIRDGVNLMAINI